MKYIRNWMNYMLLNQKPAKVFKVITDVVSVSILYLTKSLTILWVFFLKDDAWIVFTFVDSLTKKGDILHVFEKVIYAVSIFPNGKLLDLLSYDMPGLMTELGLSYKPTKWRLFINFKDTF